MISDAPEFHTKPTSPIPPVPYHHPLPSKSAVLQKKIDPVFNMTSTHTKSADDFTSTANPADNHKDFSMDADMVADADQDAADDTSFSDPYEEQDEPEKGGAVEPAMPAGGEVDDDYAMTFESDGEMGSNSQEVSNEDGDQDIQSVPAPLLGSEIVSSLNLDPSIVASTEPFDNASLNPTTSPPTTSPEHAPVAIDGAPAPAMVETPKAPSQPPVHSYEGVTNGEIDIQQLLDNITANAELNASANVTPTTATVNSPKFPPAPSALPSHSSLPPRPQVVQKPPMHPAYTSQDDIRKYHAGPSFAGPPGTSFRAPSMPMSIVAAGAPGTRTDPRNVLPPPPSASFNAPPTLSAPPPSATLPPHPQHQRVTAQDRPQMSIETGDAEDDGEIQWGPDVQKLYDAFLADERMYVSEGLWDRFPAGSRLFIGKIYNSSTWHLLIAYR